MNRFELYNDIEVIATQILENCVAAKSRSVPPALAKADARRLVIINRTNSIIGGFHTPDILVVDCSKCLKSASWYPKVLGSNRPFPLLTKGALSVV